jgi:hypothetical protein
MERVRLLRHESAARQKLAEERGFGAEEIAARFGVTPHVVRQRLRLGAVSPKLMEVYRSGDLAFHLFPWASLVINGHSISTPLPPIDRMDPRQLLSSTCYVRFDASRLRSGAEQDHRGAEIRIDVFPPTRARPLAGGGGL